jgi:lipopolysaccharide transport system permease protein
MGLMTRTLRQMYRYRHLLSSLIVRAFARKQYRTRLGLLWLILQPVVTVVMYTLVFSVIVRIPADGIPYPLFFLTGYIPWAYFSNVFVTNSRAITLHTNYIENYNFPHILLICVALITELVEVTVGFVALLLFILILRVPIAGTFWLVIPLFLVEVILLAGLSLWLAPLIARYPDLDLLLQPFIRFFFHVLPVIYPLSAVPEYARTAYLLNPFAGLIHTMQAVMFDTIPLYSWALVWAIICAMVLLVSGVYFFQSQVKHFADIA